MKPTLSVGMASYDDFDGVYFTVQSLRIHDGALIDEIIVVDNHPSSAQGRMTKDFLESWAGPSRYIAYTDVNGTAAPRDQVFRHASSDIVLCMDPHVLLLPGAIRGLLGYFEASPDSRDLVSGPLLYDDLTQYSTHLDDVWRAEMWGTWATDPRGQFQEPFEIGAMGLGVFAMRRSAWPGFNPQFREFGGEEWYIHEKVRQRGGRCLCIPQLKWVHRFGRPSGISYPLTRWHRMRNYVIGHREVGLLLERVRHHFVDQLGTDTAWWEALMSTDPPPIDAPR